MACNYTCRLCDRLIFSQAVTFAGGTLTINLPAGSYADGEKYCLVITQTIPDTTTIGAAVNITIGAGTEIYPLLRQNGAQAVATDIRTRTRYATRVSTTATGGSFRLLGRQMCCMPDNTLPAIDGGAAAGGATT